MYKIIPLPATGVCGGECAQNQATLHHCSTDFFNNTIDIVSQNVSACSFGVATAVIHVEIVAFVIAFDSLIVATTSNNSKNNKLKASDTATSASICC